ncbi:hypothetical protein AAFF_G00160900 [Aldrovandia affinis]|uniref:Uncharacterized protein n=1 Tax=Aldrovandia affinis TaxID=143900 RepID=A0AAD7R0N1_9TELE|nr:hypothetical protein AAFF_G00160900 [Aldrovandia affinis]
MTLGRLTRQPANSHLAELRVMERTHQHLQKQLWEMQLLEKQVPANRGDLCDAYYERTDGYGTTGKRLKTKHDRSWQQADSVQEQIEYDYKPGSAVAHYAKGAFSKTLKQEAIDEVIDKPQPTRDYYTQEATRAVAGEHRKKTHKTGDNRELMQLTDARVYRTVDIDSVRNGQQQPDPGSRKPFPGRQMAGKLAATQGRLLATVQDPTTLGVMTVDDAWHAENRVKPSIVTQWLAFKEWLGNAWWGIIDASQIKHLLTSRQGDVIISAPNGDTNGQLFTIHHARGSFTAEGHGCLNVMISTEALFSSKDSLPQLATDLVKWLTNVTPPHCDCRNQLITMVSADGAAVRSTLDTLVNNWNAIGDAWLQGWWGFYEGEDHTTLINRDIHEAISRNKVGDCVALCTSKRMQGYIFDVVLIDKVRYNLTYYPMLWREGFGFIMEDEFSRKRNVDLLALVTTFLEGLGDKRVMVGY